MSGKTDLPKAPMPEPREPLLPPLEHEEQPEPGSPESDVHIPIEHEDGAPDERAEDAASASVYRSNTTGYLAVAALALAALAGCSDADVASQNLSKAADQFEITRRVVFYNGITDSYMLTIEGRCSLGNNDKARELTVTCKLGPNAYKKHFLGISDNVTYFVEQIDPAPADPFQYRVVFKPQSILPDIQLRTRSGSDG